MSTSKDFSNGSHDWACRCDGAEPLNHEQDPVLGRKRILSSKPFDVIAVKHIRGSKTYAIITELKYLTDSAGLSSRLGFS